MRSTSWFDGFARWSARAAGHPLATIVSFLTVAVWAVTGPVFGYSDTWQLVINTYTTVVTFLIVFLIQATQNRDGEAMHLKLDELIRATQGAHLALLDLEEMSEEELDGIREQYAELAREAREDTRRGGDDTDAREVDGGRPGARR